MTTCLPLWVIQIVRQEKVSCGDEADDGDGPPHRTAIDSSAVVGSEVAAEAGKDRHLETKTTLHPTREYEVDRWNSDGHDGRDHFQCVDLVNVVDAADA